MKQEDVETLQRIMERPVSFDEITNNVLVIVISSHGLPMSGVELTEQLSALADRPTH